MGCQCASHTVAVAVDARVTSERDGSLAVTWNDPSQWAALAGATAIEVVPLILHREGSPTLTLVAEASPDGRSFVQLPGIATRCSWGPTADPEPIFIHLLPGEAAPVVRFGLQVAGAGEQAAVRLTLMIVVARNRVSAWRTSAVVASLAGASEPLADATTSADSMTDTAVCSNIVWRVAGTITGTLLLELHTSDDGITFTPITGATMSLTAGSPSATDVVVATDGVMRYARIYTASANTGSAVDVSASLLVRAQ